MNTRVTVLLPYIFGSVAACVILLWHIPAARPHIPDHADVVIFAPHPDDATLCCAGVIQQAQKAGQSVLVVNITNGDDFASAAAILSHISPQKLRPMDYQYLGMRRQTEELHAMHTLGLLTDHVVFLGYPDGYLPDLLAAETEPVLNKETLRSATYGLRRQDYHSNTHGNPALYMKQNAINDIAEILTRTKPSVVYVTNPHDTAPDHNAAYWLVYEAIKQTQYPGELRTYVIHAPDWPNPPEATPDKPFIPIGVANNVWQPTDLPWVTRNIFAAGNPEPALPIHVRLTPEETITKYNAISRYRSQITPGDYPLFGFVKNEEVFW